MIAVNKKKVVIVGAGPAGLTAAYELLKHDGFQVFIIEKSADFGGLSRTVNFNGNRIDIGGHRFFSKSDVVMNWWQEILPIEDTGQKEKIFYQGKEREVSSFSNADPASVDEVMLVRKRLSRIFYVKKFFAYPLSLSLETIKNLGPIRLFRAGTSYVWAMLFPIHPENNLEDFYINRFGKFLYQTFFRDYTEKVWGVPCKKIPADWGAQRVKGLSISKALGHIAKNMWNKVFGGDQGLGQKGTETSLIEKFLYPKHGPGQMWQKVARLVKEKGAEIIMESNVDSFFISDNKISGIAYSGKEGERREIECDYVISTMPVSELIKAMDKGAPQNVKVVAEGLEYRDFITVGVLLNKMLPAISKTGIAPDNWIYIQEPYVKVGRVQIFNNWSPFMVKDKNKIWIGMEYFSNQDDEMWSLTEAQMKELAVQELEELGFANAADVVEATVIKMEKAYPAYFGSYDRFHEVRTFTDSIPNLFLVGRNGMHRYNNQDHSMLTAMEAASQIISGKVDKEKIWSINTEQEYHEDKK